MEIKVEDGLNIISIGLSDIGSYFKLNKPISVVWFDCGGSVAKYICMLPVTAGVREEYLEKIRANLYDDFTRNIAGLYSILKPLFRLFANGDYTVRFSNTETKDFFKYPGSEDAKKGLNYSAWHIESAKLTVINDQESEVKKHRQFLKGRSISEEKYNSSLLEYSTSSFYDGDYIALIATKPHDQLDIDRITHFENEIKAGRRPFAILLESYFEEIQKHPDGLLFDNGLHSATFILDGHHKLMAYKKLGLYPPVAVITHHPRQKNDLEFDTEQLALQLWPWQTEHILKNKSV